MPEILLHVHARKFLERLDAKTRARIVRAMEKTAADPESSPNLSPLQVSFRAFIVCESVTSA